MKRTNHQPTSRPACLCTPINHPNQPPNHHNRPNSQQTFLTASLLWHLLASTAFMAVLWAVAPHHNSAAFVLSTWQPGTDIHGITSKPYIVVVRVHHV